MSKPTCKTCKGTGHIKSGKTTGFVCPDCSLGLVKKKRKGRK